MRALQQCVASSLSARWRRCITFTRHGCCCCGMLLGCFTRFPITPANKSSSWSTRHHSDRCRFDIRLMSHRGPVGLVKGPWSDARFLCDKTNIVWLLVFSTSCYHACFVSFIFLRFKLSFVWSRTSVSKIALKRGLDGFSIYHSPRWCGFSSNYDGP